MEEIKIENLEQNALNLNNAYYSDLVKRSKEGALVGMPWNVKVYNYLFESGLTPEEINLIMNVSGFYVVDALEGDEI